MLSDVGGGASRQGMAKEKEVVLKCSVSEELERVITHIQLNESRITRSNVTKAEILLMIVKLALKYHDYDHDKDKFGKGGNNCTLSIPEEFWYNDAHTYRDFHSIVKKSPFFKSALVLGCAYYRDQIETRTTTRSLRFVLLDTPTSPMAPP
jgi:hypothetical protein